MALFKKDIKSSKAVLKISFCFIGIMLLSAIFTFSKTITEEWKNYPYNAPGGLLIFPRDEGSHKESKMEWWYFNLHLKGKKTGKSYGLWAGYYYTFNTRFIAYANNTENKFISEVFLGKMSAEKGEMNLKHISPYGTDQWYQVEGKPFAYILKVYFKNIVLDVVMECTKPPLPLDNDGLINLNKDEFTYYYSLTNMKVSGILTVAGISEEVEGIGWEDHQWGNFSLQSISMGFGHEWFSVQVKNDKGNDPIEIIFYQLFTPEQKIINPVFSMINSDNSIFSTTDFTIERLAFWKSPDENFYSNKWRLIEKSQDIDLEIIPYQDNQLLYPPFFLPFREGPCYVKGKIRGISYQGTAYAESFKRYEKEQILQNQK